MQRRRSNPSVPVPPDAVHATRRIDGPRRDSTQRVMLRVGGRETPGWTLNISRGGARLVVEEPVEPAMVGTLELSDDPAERQVRVVWVQDEADGQIVGLQFVDGESGEPPPPSDPGKATIGR